MNSGGITSVITTGPDGAPIDEASQQSTLSNTSAGKFSICCCYGFGFEKKGVLMLVHIYLLSNFVYLLLRVEFGYQI